MTACKNGHIKVVEFMYQNPEKFDFSVKDENFCGPFEVLFKYAVAHKIPLNGKSEFGDICLDLVLQSQDPDLIDLFKIYADKIRLSFLNSKFWQLFQLMKQMLK